MNRFQTTQTQVKAQRKPETLKQPAFESTKGYFSLLKQHPHHNINQKDQRRKPITSKFSYITQLSNIKINSRVSSKKAQFYRIELLPAKICIFHRLLPGNNAVPQAIIQPPVILPIDVPLRLEPPNLAAEARGELGRIESINQSDAALPAQQLLVVGIDIISEYRHQPHARDHHAFLRVRLALGRSNGGGGGDLEGELLGREPRIVAGQRGGAVRGEERLERRGAEGGGVEGLHGGAESEGEMFRWERGRECR